MKHTLRNLSEYGVGSYGTPRVLTWGPDAKLRIGRYCSLAGEITVILQAEHRPDWITTYPFTVKRGKQWPEVRKIKGHPTTKGDIIIGNDVWIGWGVVLLSGITIGDGAVVGAYSVVAKDIPPYCIAVGNPVRNRKKLRFSQDIVEKLLEIRWWDWPEEKIRENIDLICSDKIEEFVRRFG